MPSKRLSSAEAKEQAAARFAKAEVRDRQVASRIEEQAKSQAAFAAKTQRLRALRMARDAEIAQQAKDEPPVKKVAKPRAKAKAASA